MAVSCDARFTTPTGPARADELTRRTPATGWQRLSTGHGSKGHRLYDWLLLDPGADTHLLLVRRSISTPGELAYYICHTRHPVPVAELVWRASHFPDIGPYKVRPGMEDGECRNGEGSLVPSSRLRP